MKYPEAWKDLKKTVTSIRDGAKEKPEEYKQTLWIADTILNEIEILESKYE